MELRRLVKQWTDYSANDGRTAKLITEEPVLQYRSIENPLEAGLHEPKCC